jgi:excisionase family DNA binding protein
MSAVSRETRLTLWDALDVARFLKVSRSWVYERTMAGELPSIRIGGLRRFDPEAIKAYAGLRKPTQG